MKEDIRIMKRSGELNKVEDNRNMSENKENE